MRSMPRGEPTRVVEIVDRYLPGPGLRLRAMSGADGTTYKLTQKVAAPDGGPGTLTTIYLGAEEAASLHGLEAYVLRKTRTSLPPYGIDVFHDALAGLVLAEAEVVTRRWQTSPPSPTLLGQSSTSPATSRSPAATWPG